MKTFETAPKTETGGISFSSFKSICFSLDQQLSENLICKVFRTAWAISKGQVDCKSFFIAAQEESLFYHCLQLRGLGKALLLDQSQNIKEQSSSNSAKLAYELYLKNRQGLNMVKEICKGLGVAELIENIYRLEDLMLKKAQEPLENYNGLELSDVFRHLWMVVIKIQTIYEEYNKKLLYNTADINGITKATENFLNAVQGLLLNKLQTKFAIRKIQKVWKEKARKSVAVAATVVKTITLLKRNIKKG